MFLDRDGVICYDVHYMRSPDQFVLMPGVAEGIRRLNGAGFLVVVATNQSGIRRGYFTEEDLARIHERMMEELGRRGARLDAIYYCPCLPEEDCECRKPRPGMLLRAAEELGIDLGRSYIVGDKELDVEAGRAAGCTTILVGNDPGIDADYVVEDFQWAVEAVFSDASRKGILGPGGKVIT
ncbi:D-glycero-D-manno-heptose 1,7-bisphosphate phosphatase [Conexivisphaera calida]|uniref:D,D-heptose 1,7-bisphosphate phosphatase n=1 Tax=Conexivisphaera calida TaxID=1874277 RepID=A0A4P2VF45_9ARCH|nr:D-glycero-D-manno-heptose 1,7-bisphosphate phosphatase [Conexivisphaera calida]